MVSKATETLARQRAWWILPKVSPQISTSCLQVLTKPDRLLSKGKQCTDPPPPPPRKGILNLGL